MENKVSIKLPEWADNVSCQVNNGMVDVEFIPKKEFKYGDILASNMAIVIYNNTTKGGAIICYGGLSKECNKIVFYNDPNIGFGCTKYYRYATEGEKQKLFDAMAKKGLKWNAEKKQVEKIRWRAEHGGGYYYINEKTELVVSVDTEHKLDRGRWDCGNYFKTSKEAELKAEKIKEILKGD